MLSPSVSQDHFLFSDIKVNNCIHYTEMAGIKTLMVTSSGNINGMLHNKIHLNCQFLGLGHSISVLIDTE